jgi:hypothetical protein
MTLARRAWVAQIAHPATPVKDSCIVAGACFFCNHANTRRLERGGGYVLRRVVLQRI